MFDEHCDKRINLAMTDFNNYRRAPSGPGVVEIEDSFLLSVPTTIEWSALHIKIK